MLVIRRMVTRTKSYTVIYCGDYVKKIPTTRHEHGEIMKIFKQDKRYKDILNDFTDFNLDYEECDPD